MALNILGSPTPYDGDSTDLLRAATLRAAYHFCPRCWLPRAPVRRCHCPALLPDDLSVEQRGRLTALAHAVDTGVYVASDRAPVGYHHLAFLRWLYQRGRIGEHVYLTIDEVSEDGA